MPRLVEDLFDDLSRTWRVERGRHTWWGVNPDPSAAAAAARSVDRGASYVDQVAVLGRHGQLTSVQAPNVAQCGRQPLQLVEIRRGLQRRGHPIEQLVARDDRCFGFGPGHARLSQLEVSQLQAFVIHRVTNDRESKTFATRVLQLAQRQLDADIVAAFGARWHFDWSARVDDQSVSGAQVPLVADAMNVGDGRGHDDLDRLTDRLVRRKAEQPFCGRVPQLDEPG